MKIGYKVAGRETLAAIEEELSSPNVTVSEPPLIEISETPAGRDTMAAIAEELTRELRPRQNTLPYADRIPNAPGARAPSRAPKPKDDAPAAETPGSTPAGLEIFELLTFILRGNQVTDLSTQALRRRFVEENLLHRIPSRSLDSVERIEVTPWTAKGTMVLRIWCKA